MFFFVLFLEEIHENLLINRNTNSFVPRGPLTLSLMGSLRWVTLIESDVSVALILLMDGRMDRE